MTRIARQGLAIGRQRLVAAAQAAQHDAQAVGDGRIAGRQGLGAFQPGQRLGQPSQAAQRFGAVVMGGGDGGIQGQRAIQGGDRVREARQAQQRAAAIVMRREKSRLAHQHAVEGRQRVLAAAGALQGEAVIEPCPGIGLAQDRLGEKGQRFAGAILLQAEQAEQAVGGTMGRIAAQYLAREPFGLGQAAGLQMRDGLLQQRRMVHRDTGMERPRGRGRIRT